jgi:hypothetical protein
LVQHEVARQFFEEVVRQAKKAELMSAEHFTVDGTLIEAWASLNANSWKVGLYLFARRRNSNENRYHDRSNHVVQLRWQRQPSTCSATRRPYD